MKGSLNKAQSEREGEMRVGDLPSTNSFPTWPRAEASSQELHLGLLMSGSSPHHSDHPVQHSQVYQ